MKKVVLFFAVLVNYGLSQGQTQFWFDDFENATAPSSGTRTPQNNTGSSTDYFMRATNADLDLTSSSDGNYSGFQGTYFWAGENHKKAFGNGSEEQQIVWEIDIADKAGITFSGLFAANGTDEAFENAASGHPHTDYVILEYAIDGAAYETLVAFYSKSAADKQLYEDTDGDLVGDGNQLSKVFSSFTKSIVGQGTTLHLKLRAFSNSNFNEEWAIDDFQLSYSSLCNITASAFSFSPSCKDGADGVAIVNASGGTGTLSYSWSPSGGNTSSVSNLSPGMYTCTISDVAGCEKTIDVTIDNPSGMTSVTSTANVSCNGANDGMAVLEISGGNAPYAFDWSNGETSSMISGLSGGSFSCTVTDFVGCSEVFQVTITEPIALVSNEVVTACGSYVWTDGNTYSATGVYTQNLTAINGCDSTAMLDLTIMPDFQLSIDVNDHDLTAIGNAVQYQWMDCTSNQPINGETAKFFTAPNDGVYTVWGVNADGCEHSCECVTIAPAASLWKGTLSKDVIKLYPNPVDASSSIEFPGHQATAEVYDVEGKLMMSLESVSSGSLISFELLDPGVYMIRVLNEEGDWSEHFIKK